MCRNITLTLLLSCIIFCFCGCASRDWDNARKSHTIDAYKDFLVKHPQNKHTNEAKKIIEKIYYEQYVSSNTATIETIDEFLEKYPRGILYEHARKKKEKLEYNIKVDSAYATIKTIDDFLSKYHSGVYHDKAIKIRDKKMFKIAKKQNTVRSYKKYLKEYPVGDFSKKSKNYIKNINKNLQNIDKYFSKFKKVNIRSDKFKQNILSIQKLYLYGNNDEKERIILLLSDFFKNIIYLKINVKNSIVESESPYKEIFLKKIRKTFLYNNYRIFWCDECKVKFYLKFPHVVIVDLSITKNNSCYSKFGCWRGYSAGPGSPDIPGHGIWGRTVRGEVLFFKNNLLYNKALFKVSTPNEIRYTVASHNGVTFFDIGPSDSAVENATIKNFEYKLSVFFNKEIYQAVRSFCK